MRLSHTIWRAHARHCCVEQFQHSIVVAHVMCSLHWCLKGWTCTASSISSVLVSFGVQATAPQPSCNVLACR
jgi:hypothetical protein